MDIYIYIYISQPVILFLYIKNVNTSNIGMNKMDYEFFILVLKRSLILYKHWSN